jgi:hypothetical protein
MRDDTACAEAADWPESNPIGPDCATTDPVSDVPLRLRRDALPGKDQNMVWMAGRKA